MAIIKWTPFYEPLFDWERNLGNMLPSESAFNPAIDLYEKDSNLVAEVALAGIDPEKVSISIEDNILTIEGHSEKKTEIDETNYYRREVRAGSFHRLISLPTAVNSHEVKAEYEQGILRVTMPKKEQNKPQKINIDIKSK